MEPVASMAAYNFYDGREREIPAQRAKHHSYDLRFKLRAVAAAKKSIITADEQEFGVDSTINARFE